MLRWILLFLIVAGVPAEAVEARYAAYAAGVQVVDMDASFDLTLERYRVRLVFRTVGALNLVARSRSDTVVEGRFVEGRVAPERFFSSGALRGGARVTQIDYAGGRPVVRQLVPPNETEREPVGEADMIGTVDTLSAMAELVHQVNTTGRCEGLSTTFDGRRLSVLEARTSGEQVLEASGRSSFAGMTTRCEFVGRQTGGFMLDEDRATLRRPHMGTAWFAAVVPGGVKIPVRIAFRTQFFGEATMYLANK